jgi:hypothetical protein
MNGQWIGRYAGTNNGTMVLDLDDLGSVFQGLLFAYDDSPTLPRTFAYVEIPKSKNDSSGRLPLIHVERGTGASLSEADVAARFEGISVPKYADVRWLIDTNGINVEWATDIGTNGHAQLSKSKGGESSVLNAEIKSWEEFTTFVRTLEPYQFAFRGHADNRWRLRTAFHRAGRSYLFRFMAQDVSALHRHLSGLTTHRFNLLDPIDYAAFLNLAQHHGYPTPILDWTQSPFVAAYFAFRDAKPSSEKVRIFILEDRTWNTLERAPGLMPGFTHMTLLEPLAINNPRALPQQSISAITNINDLETYIETIERQTTKSYLRVIDLPIAERKRAMQDLALMGITAGSMFPGLDGACQQLKERFFDL